MKLDYCYQGDCRFVMRNEWEYGIADGCITELGVELNPDYIAAQSERTRQTGLALECAAAAIGESGHE